MTDAARIGRSTTSSAPCLAGGGRPSIALNRGENIAHVVFAELDDYRGDNIFGLAADGDIHWYSKEYTDCGP